MAFQITCTGSQARAVKLEHLRNERPHSWTMREFAHHLSSMLLRVCACPTDPRKSASELCDAYHSCFCSWATQQGLWCTCQFYGWGGVREFRLG